MGRAIATIIAQLFPGIFGQCELLVKNKIF